MRPWWCLLVGLIGALPQLHGQAAGSEHEEFDAYRVRIETLWFDAKPSGTLQGRQAGVSLTFNEIYISSAIPRLRARRIGGSLERIISFSGLFPSIALSSSWSTGQLPSKVKPTLWVKRICAAKDKRICFRLPSTTF
jgi:hypothetical protein